MILKDFEDVSGLKLNKSKSKVIKPANVASESGLTKVGFQLTEGSIKYLGNTIWFDKNNK